MSDSPRGPLVYEFGAFRLEPARRALLRRDGTEVEIGAKAFDALCYLVQRAGTPVSRDELLKALWPRAIVEDNNLHQAIAAARRALGKQRYVATLQGRGYQFIAAVRVVDDSSQASEGRSVCVVEPNADGEVIAAPRSVLKYGLMSAVLAFVVLVAALNDYSAELKPEQLGAVLRVARVTAYPGDEYSPSLSPDGSRVAFSWNGADDNRDIYVALVDGSGVPQRLTTASDADGDPAWSPDGTRIAFLRRVTATRRDIFVVPALGGQEQYVRTISLRSIVDVNVSSPKLAWSTSGDRLLFAAGKNDRDDDGTRIYALALVTGQVTQLTSGDPPYDNSPSISRDGAWLAFRRDPSNSSPYGELLVQRLDLDLAPVGEPTRVPIPRDPPRLIHSPAWSVDARYLTFVAGDDIFEWEVGSSAARLVHAASGLGVRNGSFEVSALALHRGARPFGVAVRFTSGADIWGLPLDPATRRPSGAAKVRFYSTAGELQARFSPDGRQVLFHSNRGGASQLWIGAADESWVRPLTNLEAVDELGDPNWSPDGRHIVLSTSVDGITRSHVVAVDTGLPGPVFAGGAPSWSYDGSHVYVVDEDRPYTTARVRVADGQRALLFRGVIPVETLDSRSLLYWQLEQPHIFRRSLLGNPTENPEERLVEALIGTIAPVDEGFFYLAGATPDGPPRAFMFYEYATRTSYEVAPAPPGTLYGPGNLSVAPDGRELLYAATVGVSGADLARLEFESFSAARSR